MPDRVLAIPGRGVVPADTPVLRADDLGVLRGDGLFETVHVRGGRPWLLDEHLDRMSRSAARLGIPLPPAADLTALAEQACTGWGADEGALRLVCTRGAEHGDGTPTLYATLNPVGEASRRARRDGIRVLTASLGLAAAARSQAPWLLGGVKSLSYAVNMASLRWATESGADDVLWVSGDGYLLEAPTASLVWLDGDTLCTVPAEATGILPGTTARWLCEHAEKLGWQAEERMARPADLFLADAAWLASSVRGLAEIRTLDGTDLPPSEHTARIQDLLGFGVPAAAEEPAAAPTAVASPAVAPPVEAATDDEGPTDVP
ncbi:aminotransferase class IV [Rhizomonospora bruguierae]|uniref:aminotransferase class IV n=1 Tax=Rhizomonospora bruguierae TaxID=1581705 RepID=UPI0020C0EB78|nr:aminotransferase class IV [Micromonospora sp. NBRC 107566]